MSLLSKGHLPAGSLAVRCRDIARRRRSIVVTVLAEDRIMVTVPPGEVAVLTPYQAQQLRDELRTAVLHPTGKPATRTDPDTGDLLSYHAAIPCHDGFQRERTLIVASTNGGHVTVSAPAGSTAVPSPLRVGHLRRALRNAIAITRTHHPEPDTQATATGDHAQVTA